ncbi:hypothetical protein BURPS1710b_1904 [Burkholderia pseudomallei 1710b]|uniref:Uncharacterized protein n=4 Tax=pseudomallei group TaxID=111527 RepID=Q3JT00_BURP1|nr:hypothetical protein BURPS1710b_1904 [Burkholderia pseudomallei 1710b]
MLRLLLLLAVEELAPEALLLDAQILRIDVADVVQPLRAIAIVDREIRAIERQADMQPRTIVRFRERHFRRHVRHRRSARCARCRRARDVLRGDRRCRFLALVARRLRARRRRIVGDRHACRLHARVVLRDHGHQALQVFGLEAGIVRFRLPLARIVVRARQRLAHSLLADEHVGAAVRRGVEARAVLVALRRHVRVAHRLRDHAANQAVVDLRMRFVPVGFHHALVALLDDKQETLLLPEAAHLRPDLRGRLVVDHEPALGAVALNVHARHGGRDRIGRRRGLLHLLQAGKRRRAALRRQRTLIRRLVEHVGRHRERHLLRFRVALVVDFRRRRRTAAGNERAGCKQCCEPLGKTKISHVLGILPQGHVFRESTFYFTGPAADRAKSARVSFARLFAARVPRRLRMRRAPLLSYACACMGPRRARTSASARCAAHPRPLGITSIRFPQFQAPRAPALTIMN